MSDVLSNRTGIEPPSSSNSLSCGPESSDPVSPGSVTMVRVGSTKVFVPFSEEFVARHGMSLGDLVPFRIQYTCLRMADEAARYGWSDVEIEEPA